MCKSCNAFSWNNRFFLNDSQSDGSLADDFVTVQLGAYAADAQKLSDAFPGPDGVGDGVRVNPLAPAGVIGVPGSDDAPNAIGPGVPTITVHPTGTAMSPETRTVGTLELNGDQDYRQITLVAGKTYEIHMYGLAGGPNAVALADAYIELYDAAGNFVTAADGGAHTVANEVNSGFDVLLTFTAEVSGTFYINSRAYDNTPFDGTTGEGVGDYELFVREVDPNAPGTYRPYYDVDSPLHSIDWGSRLINKIHETARNPDGNEGTRDTGNAQGTAKPYDGPNQAQTTGNPNGFANAPAFYDDPAVDSNGDGNPIGDGNQLLFTVPGKNVITVYYAKAGEEYKYDDPTQPGLTEIITAKGFETFELTAMRNALASYSDVADIVYIELDEAYVRADLVNPQNNLRAYADLTIVLYNGTPRTGLLGRHSPPDEGNEGQGEYNALGPGWNAKGLAPGGFSFVTLVHELGHGHGLAHPHDTGGGSSIMRGVKPQGSLFSYTSGDFDLNQAIYTVMSYEDGWPKSPYGNASTSAGFGYQTGLSAFDIAVIQDKYGVNQTTRTGNDVYVLPEANAVATFNPDGTLATKATGYTTIWDAGGIDEIRYNGARNATIDLRAATLKYELGGGGWMSYTTGANPVYAGFTIANGAIIENATSGAGNDILRGNSAANVLNAGDGADRLFLQDGGNDTAVGGGGNDSFYFGAAFTAGDTVNGGDGADAIILQGNYGAGVTLGTGTVSNISGLESISLAPGHFADWGDTAGNFYDYNLIAIDANVPAGGILRINGHHLRAGEDLTFNGSLETDGRFFVFGGLGVDNLVGGNGNDIFVFGHDGRFGQTDVVHGGVGYDSIYLRGDYNLDFTLGGFGIFTGIESLTLGWASDSQFVIGGDGEFDYNFVWDDAMLADDARITVNGSGLAANETMLFNGADEAGGDFRLFGGAADDTITGGGGDDLIYGGLGADLLKGNGGADVFRYQDRWESYADPNAFDTVQGFTHGVDKFDLSIIDANVNAAGDQAFRFIGSAAFSTLGNSVGELRAFQTDAATNTWRIEADVTGDGSVDFMVQVVVEAGQPLTAADFIL